MRSIAIATGLLLLLGGFFLGFSGSVDDAHITFWSAWVLAHDGQIVNYNFERVEQSSTLLQVLLLAVLHKLSGFSVVDLAHITTVLTAIVALFLASTLYRRIDRSNITAMLLLLASSPFFVYWSFGGMEGPLLACMLLLCVLYWSDYLCADRGGVVGLLVLALATQSVRPEVPLVACVIVAGIVFIKLILRDKLAWCWQRIAVLAAVQLLAALALLCWRWWYFDSLWPQPIVAKIGSGMVFNVFQGLGYAWQAASNPLLALPAVVVILAFPCLLYQSLRRPRPELLLIAIVAAAYTAFVISSGGDWMAAGRFWVPVMPLFVIMMLWLLNSCCTTAVLRYGVVALIVAGNIMYLWQGTTIDFNNVPLWKKTKLTVADKEQDFSFFERHAREHLHDIPTTTFAIPLLQQILAKRGDEKPIDIMTGQAGMVMYHLNTLYPHQLHITDRNGLIERTFTACDLARDLPRTRMGLGNDYIWITKHASALQQECGMRMPDVVFDIAAYWNRQSNDALRNRGYVFIYNQRGHIVEEGDWLPIRKIGAGQFIAVSPAIWELLGKPEPVSRIF